jgi:predicted nucleic acid-binding protein
VNPEDVPEGPLLLDTDVASFLHTGRNAEPFKPLVANHLLCLSFATVGELWFGAEHAGWGEKRRAALEAFMHQFVVIPVDDVIARCWSRIHAAVCATRSA